MWGQAERQGGHSSAPRSPALLGDGHRGVGIRQVSAGSGFSCAVTWAGGVLCWGNNAQSQCGVPAAECAFIAQPRALQLPAATAAQSLAVEISCGAEHAACVTGCGAVYSWGSNAQGQLGRVCSTTPHAGAASCASSPQPVMPMMYAHAPDGRAATFCQVACGGYHTVALARDGSVWMWGAGEWGQCGPDVEGVEEGGGAAGGVGVRGSVLPCVLQAALGISVSRVRVCVSPPPPPPPPH